MTKKAIMLVVVLLLTTSLLIVGCSDSDTEEEEVGTLQFHANGEDFVRQGFTSKDGWNLTFDHAYFSLDDIIAYQTDPPYEPQSGASIDADVSVKLPGTHTVDLAEGAEDALPLFVGEVTDAKQGHYNAISWKMIKAESGPAAGYSVTIIGTAEKEGTIINFALNVENEYAYTCGEYVGAERKGFLANGGTADAEMTFHFDHLFGDAGTPPDDTLNTGALGFEPFVQIAEGETLNENLAGLNTKLSPDDYQKVMDILPTLGHSGEGHCHCE